jgi:type IV secretion system protein VirB1
MEVLALSLLLLPSRLLAGECTFDATAYYNISPLLVEAIQEVESGKNPYAINVQFYSNRKKAVDCFTNFLKKHDIKFSKNRVLFSIFPDDRSDAEKVIKFIVDNPAVRTYDVGLMQINKFWIEKYRLNPAWLLDRCYNVRWGCYVLSTLVRKYGYTWKAVWKYNGSRRYVWEVLDKVKKLCKTKYKDESYCRKYFVEEVGKR